MRKFTLCALAAAALFTSAAGQAATLVIGAAGDFTGQSGFNTANFDFTLPSGFTNAQITINLFNADDRAVLQLNGTNVSNTGIFGPGEGKFQFTAGGPNQPFTFTSGNLLPHDPIVSGFTAGTNVLTFIINDTFDGIRGDTVTTAGPSGFQFTGTLSYDLAPGIPEPATWAMMMVGFGAVGYSLRRRPKRVAQPV